MPFAPQVALTAPSIDLITWLFSIYPEQLNHKALVDAHEPRRALTRQQCKVLIRQASAGLAEVGVREGECVMVHARNDIYLAILAFACFGIGAIYAQTSIAAEAAELTHCIKAAEPRWIFAEPCFEDSVQSCLDNSGVDLHGFFIFDRLDAPLEYGGSKRTFSSLFGDAERDWIRFDELQRASSTVILRSFTSGSTSLPKVVQLSHRNLAFTVALRMSLEANKEYEKRYIHSIPFFHVTAWYQTGVALAGLGVLHVSRSPAPLDFCKLCAEHRITDTYMAPQTMANICELVESGQVAASAIQTLRSIACAGAAVQMATVRRIKRIVGSQVVVSSAYGMTECGGITSLPHPEEPNVDPFPLGRNGPGVTLMLLDVDTDAEITQPNQPGELLIHTPGALIDYFGNPGATAALTYYTADGTRWLRTGDLVLFDAQLQQWVMLGRAGEGFKIYEGGLPHSIRPKLVEDALAEHTGTLDAACGPLADAQGDKHVAVWVSLRKDGPVATVDELQEYLKGKMDKWHRPRHVFVVDAIPRNASGKIMRAQLRALQ